MAMTSVSPKRAMPVMPAVPVMTVRGAMQVRIGTPVAPTLVGVPIPAAAVPVATLRARGSGQNKGKKKDQYCFHGEGLTLGDMT